MLHFEDLPHDHVNHSFTVANVQSPIIGLDLLSKLHAVVDVHNKSITFNHTQVSSPDLSSLPLINYQNLSCDDLLNLFPDVISGEFFQGKCLLPVEHTFSVKGLPFSHAARKLGPQKYKELNSHIDKMLNQGIIEYSRSSFTSPVHLVPKKEPGAFRFCVDYRTLNAQTENQCFTLPRISDVTHRLHGSHVFSALDLKNAYWQINVRAADRKYTAFSCPRGTFQFRKMPMGTKNSAFTFQMAISYILQGTENFAFAYIDDILIFSKDELEHRQHLHQILHRLQAYGMSLNISKSTFAVSEIEFLGHKLTSEGVFILKDRVDAIDHLTEPTTIRELRQALGLINFQRRFIKDAAKILLPLTKYLQGQVKNSDKITFNLEAKQAFSDIKTALNKATGLAHPQEEAKLKLYTDASQNAMGAVLVQQLPDQSEQALAYYSKALNDCQKRYAVFDQELLAVFSAVKHFECFLLDRHFTIVTDHLPLVHAFKKPSTSHSPRQSRQLSYLTEFNCTVTHVPGAHNEAADCLSRLVIHNIFAENKLPINITDIAKEQQRCLQANTQTLCFPQDTTLQIKEVDASCGADTVKLLVDNSLGHQRIVIPPKFENQIIDHYHSLNHLGIKATQRFISARFVFHAMCRKITDRVRACTGCQRSKVYRHVVSPVTSCKMPSARFDTVHADLCGPYPECQGFSYLLVCIDRFSRFVTAYPLRNIQTESVIIGMNAYISTFGQMRVLRVDNGVQWTSNLFKNYVTFLGCELSISNTRYPESNGLVERVIKNIKVALTAKLDRNHWLFHLGAIILSLNTMHREELGCSPAELMFFQGLRLPGDFFTTPPPAYLPLTQSIISQMKAFAASLRPTPTRVVQSRPIYIPPELKTCSHVFIKVDPIKPNLTPTYAGPYPVISRTEKTFKVLHNDKLQQVAINNVKPSFPLQSPEHIAAESPIFSLPSSQNAAISSSITFTKSSSTYNDKTSEHEQTRRKRIPSKLKDFILF